MGENQISKLVPNRAMKEGPGLPFHSRWEKLDKTRVMITVPKAKFVNVGRLSLFYYLRLLNYVLLCSIYNTK